MLAGDTVQLAGDVCCGLIPAGTQAVNHGVKQAALVGQGVRQGRPFGAQFTEIGRVVGITLNAGTAVRVSVYLYAATHSAVSAGTSI